MGGRASKQKGSAFERVICKQLSLWVTGGQREDCFWRSAMSGGRSTVAYKRGAKLARQAGDISATAPEGHAFTDHFYVECKAYRQLGLDRFMWLGEGAIAPMWRETIKQAALYRREPMMIVKQNGFPPLVVLRAYPSTVPQCPAVFARPGLAIVKLDDLTAFLFPIVLPLWLAALPKQSLPRVRTKVRR